MTKFRQEKPETNSGLEANTFMCAYPNSRICKSQCYTCEQDIWDKAPKWAYAHAYNYSGIGYYYGVQRIMRNGKGRFRVKKEMSGLNLPIELKKNWDKTLVINPNFSI